MSDRGTPPGPLRADIAGIRPRDFEAIDAVPSLAAGELHLWVWRAAQPFPPRAISALARTELGRLLQAYAGTRAPPLIERGEHGKPFVAEAGYPQFNLSHSGRCVVYAFSADQAVGVDVEAPGRRHSPLELAARFFAPAEAQALAALAEDRQGAAFLQLWTSKEAVLKAMGHGLSFGLDRVRLRLDEGAHSASLQAIDGAADAPETWQLHRFESAPGYAGTLAWRGPPLRVRSFRLAAAGPDDRGGPATD